MALPDMQAMDDIAALASLGRADREAVLRLLSNVERATLRRRMARARMLRVSKDKRAIMKLAQFSPALRRALRRALTEPAHNAGVTLATQHALRALLFETQHPGAAE